MKTLFLPVSKAVCKIFLIIVALAFSWHANATGRYPPIKHHSYREKDKLTSQIVFESIPTKNDTAQVLQKCLDLPALQKYYPKNADGTYKQLYIMQLPVKFPAGLTLSKFNKDILFRKRGEIYAEKAEAFFNTKTFLIDGNTATVTLAYNYNYLTSPSALDVQVTLEKNGSTWTVINSQIQNR